MQIGDQYKATYDFELGDYKVRKGDILDIVGLRHMDVEVNNYWFKNPIWVLKVDFEFLHCVKC